MVRIIVEDKTKSGWHRLQIFARRSPEGVDCYVVSFLYSTDPRTGEAVQREFGSFEEALKEYETIMLRAVSERIELVRQYYLSHPPASADGESSVF